MFEPHSPAIARSILPIFFALLSVPVPGAPLGTTTGPQTPPSTWPQPCEVARDKAASTLTLRTPYYAVQHDLRRGGTISGIRLTHGRATNLLAHPLTVRVVDETGRVYSDVFDSAPRVTTRRDGMNQLVTVYSTPRDETGHRAPIRVTTVCEYRWGYVKIRKTFRFPNNGFGIREIVPVSLAFHPGLSEFGYREGRTEAEGASPFSFGSCRWGKLQPGGPAGFDTPQVPRYVMLADPGVEGLEWFVSSDLSQWDLQVSGRRGSGRSVLRAQAAPAGVSFNVSPFCNAESPALVAGLLTFDYYLGWPVRDKHATRPWFHTSFNRNRGDWVSPAQIAGWAEKGVSTAHCHNDGDYYGDGLFWRDGSYPPYPDMEKYDGVIAACHHAGIRVATYFSNKELHSSTPQFQQHSNDWGRMNRKGELQRNFYKPGSEFGVQMCLRSGWLDNLKGSIERVLTQHALDGVYYDWNVALLCSNPSHVPRGDAADHWDMDELLQLMEWTRARVGPRGLVIIHNTTTPMFAAENFADHIVANEWGYGKWSGKGPALQDLPLEWSLVGARSRGVISYGQLGAESPRRLHRVFALEALLSGVTPWPASPETFDIFPVLKPIGALETCRFADWRNDAVEVEGERCASAIYSRPSESWVLLANLDDAERDVRCVVRPERLPCPLKSLTEAEVMQPADVGASSGAAAGLDPRQLTSASVNLKIAADSVLLLRLR